MEQSNFNQNFDAFSNQAQNQMQPKPKNYLALSIISTIFGFCSCIGLFVGIVAIVMSTQSTKKYEQGDYEGAVKAAKNAKILSLIVWGIFVLNLVYSWYNIQQMGGWDAYMESVQEAIGMMQGGGM
ncbi:CD225/dispanin family protein [Myroides odoratus]|jgi:Na+-driven multidrug efflux pump|uniref:Interferon-induced transmembrane protein n=1 Tax=Myroides odoratus TaxID=256 RepID=A0A378U465_MYROD|nr:CD225/dispanin family protein [Myroides odoratus]MDH6601468.1 Na+-driven multidrug efflux pump [Myroides gitamensis]MCS4240480.1 Na+-driven multidrug efflux pump [Myroides odoratus]MDR0224660.1 CD225/dispanin family protein [Myroides odoratus]QQU02694.1 CD225/dispanin family protein [Myroides odoratus]STZ70085.1 Interferon-induced transmembrane protein [Myroides odoratus]